MFTGTRKRHTHMLKSGKLISRVKAKPGTIKHSTHFTILEGKEIQLVPCNKGLSKKC